MIDVILYSFAKEADSTAIPNPANGVTYACELKDVCSILSPSLVFHMVDGWTPAQINYIHIPIWSRYYFASWTWQAGARRLGIQHNMYCARRLNMMNLCPMDFTASKPELQWTARLLVFRGPQT